MMRPRRLIFLLYFLLGLSGRTLAQYENMWAFCTISGVDFNSTPPVSFLSNMSGPSSEASASICDDNGQLLFYTSGSFVWNETGAWMPNGSDLTGLGGDRTSSTAQGALIAPMPGNPGKYYIFSLTSQEQETNRGRLYYSVVDMNLNGGLGDVIPGQKAIFVDSNFTESMTAVAGPSCSIWILVSSYDPVAFKAFRLTSDGLSPVPAVSGVGFAATDMTTTIGSLAASPDGRQIAATIISSAPGHMATTLFDFDPNTGLASAPTMLNGWGYKSCFSPDNSKLYITNFSSDILQFDLSSGDPTQIAASETTLEMGNDLSITDLKRGPDGKIYFVCDQNPALGVINFPNLAGSACAPAANAISLAPTMGGRSLPQVVVIPKPDTVSTMQRVNAPCFANLYPPVIHANDELIGGDTYLWNTGQVGTPLVATLPGTYWVSYYAPCQYYTDTFVVAFAYGVLPDIGLHSSCSGLATGKAWATTYPGDTVTYHYQWSDVNNEILSVSDSLLDAPAGTYSLHISTAQCDTIISFYLPEEAYHVDFIADSLVCMGDTLFFENTSDDDYTSFLWDFGDGQQTAMEQPVHSYPDPGSYQVALIGAGEICTDTLIKTIQVDAVVPGTFLMSPDSICTGSSITFQPETDSSSTISLHWVFGDGVRLTTLNEQTILHAYDEAGLMPVMLRTQFRACPETTFSDTVFVQEFPQVFLGPDTSLCLDGHPIVLRNLETTSPLSYHHFLWNTGDTTAGLRVLQPGSYSLRVSTEPLGCSTTDVIEVAKDCYTDIPNAFTPNGDGDNDYFFPRTPLSQSVNTFKMQVLNRWGQLVFETTNINGRGWDGRFNDKEQPMGVYLYLIELSYTNGRQEEYKGNVTLIR